MYPYPDCSVRISYLVISPQDPSEQTIDHLIAITGTWTLPFAAYLVLLSNRVCYDRVQNDKYLGENTVNGGDALQVNVRAHGNFLEYVPLAFGLTTIAELNGGRRPILNYAMGALLVLRILHVELGLKSDDYKGIGRPLGFFGTQAFLLGMGGYCTWLVKGYWGF